MDKDNPPPPLVHLILDVIEKYLWRAQNSTRRDCTASTDVWTTDKSSEKNWRNSEQIAEPVLETALL